MEYFLSAPKLKGRPRRKRKKRSASPGESSNESEASVASTSKSAPASSNVVVPSVGRPPSSVVRRSERKTSAEEKKFLTDVQNFMNSRGTPVGKMPLLGYRQSQYLCEVFFFFLNWRKIFLSLEHHLRSRTYIFSCISCNRNTYRSVVI